jgi:hypothetical protein
MTGKAPNWQRHDRIAAVLGGATTVASQRSAWLEHLLRTCSFPFVAHCGVSTSAEPLASGGLVQVIGLTSSQRNNAGVLAKVMDGQKSVHVSLERLLPRDAGHAVAEAVADWRSWYVESVARREV